MFPNRKAADKQSGVQWNIRGSDEKCTSARKATLHLNELELMRDSNKTERKNTIFTINVRPPTIDYGGENDPDTSVPKRSKRKGSIAKLSCRRDYQTKVIVSLASPGIEDAGRDKWLVGGRDANASESRCQEEDALSSRQVEGSRVSKAVEVAGEGSRPVGQVISKDAMVKSEPSVMDAKGYLYLIPERKSVHVHPELNKMEGERGDLHIRRTAALHDR